MGKKLWLAFRPIRRAMSQDYRGFSPRHRVYDRFEALPEQGDSGTGTIAAHCL